MEPVTAVTVREFLRRLGARLHSEVDLYLLGGSALCLLGNPRTTVDLDYTFETGMETGARFEAKVAELAADMESFFHAVLPDAPQADIIPDEFRDYFGEVRRRFGESGR